MRAGRNLGVSLLFAIGLSVHAGASAELKPQTVVGDEIVLGQTTTLTGILAQQGQANSSSSKAYFDYINSQGGIHGRKIRLITMDDGYSAEKAAANVKQLVEKDDVVALFGIIGTPANMAIMPYVNEVGIVNFAPYTGSEALREQKSRWVYHVRAGYTDETHKIIDHIVVRGIKDIGVVYQNNAFGKETLANLERILAERKIKLSVAAPIENDSKNVAETVKALAAVKPKAVLLITAGKPTVEVIRAYNEQVTGTLYFAMSVMSSQASIKALGADGVGVVVSQVAPFPFSGTTALVREYQKLMKSVDTKELSYSSIEGFVNAKIMVEALRRAGKNLTREKLAEALDGMNKVDIGGHVVNYSKTNRQAWRDVDLTVISKDGRFLR
ncbi:MAG TPA: ABC transporter substrate-binding protein [Noviherbaspirillum sp.]|jgi:ABC-type branched-subunit amino acid transport system substrate-binding protein|uniref:ABC transporter substrate-binding protein n=1 Tax=Noviherbaspirillum sp. TaxID=1926288 RepID=UPI002DDD92E8|nr:ABC transporter substrate-binding protein [Noviherbaspirillum sp.]HEV2611880.1 ABC transporter substrate-binding protein [Noviherbaspirillum sp.]